MNARLLMPLIGTLFIMLGGAPADLVLRNGKIVTVDERYGTVQAIAVRADRILAVGTNEEIAEHIGPQTKVIDLQGKFASPGFIEGHGHFTSMGSAMLNLDLMRVANWDEVIAMVEGAAKRAKPGEWIIGRGWHQEKWDKIPRPNVEGFPTHDALSAVSPDNPVCLTHASGHACFFNARAMELASVDASTPNPPGGEILKDKTGQPIGVFRETAQRLVGRFRAAEQDNSPEAVRQRIRRHIQLADKECLSKGITSFQDAGSSFTTIDIMKEMAEKGEIGTRLWVMVRVGNEALSKRLANYRLEGVGDNHLTVRAIKRSIDGALGSRGAWLLKPYSDQPQSTGLNTSTVEDISETARIAKANDFQLCVHAIGDRANREVLNIFEKTFDDPAALRRARWRIEHAQHVSAADIPRFAKLGVIASMQGVHCTSDAPYVIARLGYDRAREGAYVWRTFLDSGALVSNGTDTPVEDVSPIASYYATVSRRMADGRTFFPDQRLDRMEALKTYTINCAYAAFEEDIKGSLTPGKLADVVVLSNDILTCPEEDIATTKVLYTIVGGKVVFDGGGKKSGS